MGANLTEKALQRAARSVSTLEKIRSAFDEQTGVTEPTRAHAQRSDLEDVNKVVAVLLKNRILEPVKGRKLSQFKNFKSNPLAGLNWKQLHAWIDRKKIQLLSLKRALGGDLSPEDATDLNAVEEGDLSCEDATDIDNSTDDDEP